MQKQSSINTANIDPREFEEYARRVMSQYFGVRLEKRRKPGWPKEFDLVSPDYEIVGDAKYYTMVRGETAASRILYDIRARLDVRKHRCRHKISRIRK